MNQPHATKSNKPIHVAAGFIVFNAAVAVISTTSNLLDYWTSVEIGDSLYLPGEGVYFLAKAIQMVLLLASIVILCGYRTNRSRWFFLGIIVGLFIQLSLILIDVGARAALVKEYQPSKPVPIDWFIDP